MKALTELYKFKIAKKDSLELQKKVYFRNSELNIFRRELHYSSGFYSRTPYSIARRKTLAYKSVFLGMGLLFIVLGCFIYFSTLHNPIQFIITNKFEMIKHLICGLSLITGFFSLFICFSINVENEIINHLIRKSYRQLSKIYRKKQLQHNINSIFVFGANLKKQISLKHHYFDVTERFTILKDQTIELIYCINNSKDINLIKKELLCNQTIVELEEKLIALVDNFNQIDLNFEV